MVNTLGMENIVFNSLLIVIVIAYILAMIPIVRRSFQNDYKNKYNDLLVLILSVLVGTFLAIPYNASFLIPYPWNFFLVVFTGAYLLVHLVVGYFPSKESKEAERVSDQFGLKKEGKRKLFHALAFGYYIAFLFGPLIMIGITYIESPFLITEEYYAMVYFLAYTMDPMWFGLSFLLFIYMGSFIVMMDAELVRLNWPNSNFPLKQTLKSVKREEEKNTLAAHPHMIMSWTFSAILFIYLAPDVRSAAFSIFGMITICIFGDMMAALAGRALGKHKWSFFKEKSIEGTAIGFFSGLWVGWLFLGGVLAFLGALIFILTDIVFPKFIKISDNSLNPLLITLVFLPLLQIPGILNPLLPIAFIGVEHFAPYRLNYTAPNSWYGTFPFVLLFFFIIIVIGLMIAYKFRKEQIFLLFTGKRKDDKERNVK
ncbi:MAG: hypothetical protein EU548_00115 [Promethearchaeota archaeon]|nr:MAG: hypothetical protein EU548_00115 [Candidatus Lokiarchaeota archaeon]